MCGITSNSCSTGYQPQCATLIQCNGSASSCSCVAENPSNCSGAGSRCGGTNPSCCSGGGLSCVSDYCTYPATPPPSGGGTSTNPFCPDGTSINTAIGCIPTDPGALFTKFFKFGIGIAGGIAFLLILFGGFQILTSAGNPEQMNEGKELVSSAIAGLLLIIFSVFLLRIIGVTILGIPGFG